MDLRISSPCPLSWESLSGNDRVRFCAKCKLNVYNLAAMTEEQAIKVVQETEGRLCVRLYDRGDRTATAEDCRWGRARKRMKLALAFGALILFATLSRLLGGHGIPDRSSLPPLVREMVDWIDPEPRFVMGAPPPIQVPPAQAPRQALVPGSPR
jgi:hypothetical protein